MKAYSISKKMLWLTAATVLTMALTIGLVMGLTSMLRAPDTNMSNTPLKPMGQMPLIFVENQGQWDDRVAFMCRKPGMTAWLQKDRVTYKFEKRNGNAKANGIVMSMAFEGASEQVALYGEEEQSANYNFFIGNDHSKWRSNVIGYAKVIYRNLYPGIDLCFREDNGWLEYDLALSHGADLSDVAIRCEGLRELRIDETGDLVMETEYGPITQTPPKAWYKLPSGDDMPVDCRYCILDANSYGFCVPNSDLELALMIDPGLEWSTYLGGSADDNLISLDLTTAGNIVIAGATESVDFPVTPGAYDTTFIGGTNDGCISCISADGSQLLWSSFLGGNSIDVLFEVALDDSGGVIVAGLTTSPDFPTTPGAYDISFNGGFDGMLSCLSPDGSQMLYSTYLGTSAEDMIVALDVTNSRNACTGSAGIGQNRGRI